jgi:hypothetical protein
VSAAALVVLYAVLPLLGVRYPPASVALEALYAPADTVLDVIDVTTVLVVVAALTVVAVVRKLPYGIGAILMLCLGSTLTAAAGRHGCPITSRRRHFPTAAWSQHPR